MLLDLFAGRATVLDVLIWLFCFLLCITVHEVAHGFAAYKLGDKTAKSMGRLTLNPIPHIDIMGLLAMLIFRFGWAKPVMVDPRNFTRKITMRTGMAITAFAGPLSNLIFGFLAALIWLPMMFGVFTAPASIYPTLMAILGTLVWLNVMLAVFNLIPIPPLDGSKIVAAFLPQKMLYNYMQIERYGFLILILSLNLPILRGLLFTVIEGILEFYIRVVMLLPFVG